MNDEEEAAIIMEAIDEYFSVTEDENWDSHDLAWVIQDALKDARKSGKKWLRNY